MRKTSVGWSVRLSQLSLALPRTTHVRGLAFEIDDTACRVGELPRQT